jgi:hypothetical protein
MLFEEVLPQEKDLAARMMMEVRFNPPKDPSKKQDKKSQHTQPGDETCRSALGK